MPDLLLELFSEEIPARMQRKAADDLRRLVTDALVERGLVYEGARDYATPRRLALHVAGLPAKGRDLREERKGPRVGAPAAAVQGFLKSAGLASLDQARIETDLKKGEFYVAVIERPGRATTAVLAEVLPAIVRSFPWPKSMRWGPSSKEPGSLRWVRPLHAIVCTFGPETEEPEIVRFSLDGIEAGDTTFGHRFMAPAAIRVKRFDDYAAALERARVVLDADRRKEIILTEATNLAFAQGLEFVEDEALLEEVAGLVEWPVVLMGEFDEAFLAIPPEVIRATIRANQKCFVLRRAETRSSSFETRPAAAPQDEDREEKALPRHPHPEEARSAVSKDEGVLANRFILVANIEASDGGEAIAAGNARVVRARLSDAKFFWETDLRTTLEDRLPKLDQIVFHEKLGTQGERVERIAALAKELAPIVGQHLPEAERKELPEKAERAARLAKADLVTEMVGEFPELQGLMGRYYAERQGEDASVAAAIEEHYKPLGPSERVPSDPVSVAVALADKLDTLVGFWAIDEKPTGSKDPYALRRTALGVIRLMLENRVRLPLREVLICTYSIYVAQTWALNRLVAIQVQAFWVVGSGAHPPAVRDYQQFGRVFGSDTEYDALRSAHGNTGWQFDVIVWHLPVEALVNDLLSFFADRLKVYLRDQGARHDLIDAVFALGASPSPRVSGGEGLGVGGRADVVDADRAQDDGPPPGRSQGPAATLPTTPAASGGSGADALVQNDDLLMIVRRVEALGKFLDTEDGKNLLAGTKRAANILRIEEKKDGRTFDGAPDPALFAQDEEKALAAALDRAREAAAAAVAREDFEAAMAALAKLRAPVDRFFDKVTVNAEDARLRETRLKLLAAIRAATREVADFSKIEG